ncbi:CHAD domain-containing protein [Streptomyces poriticola]|uniref:CHAD domain-containing protein n=1 Tax=Streptomyces poriticola TaxID=3120506 RepID=UPI002FCE1BBA
MAQQHLEPTDPTAGPVSTDALEAYLKAQATEFLRALRQHRESGAGAHGGNGSEGSADAARALRRAARRISGSLHTFQPLLDTDWAESMRPELAWVSGTLAQEHAYASRLERLLQALHRLSGSAAALPSQSSGRPAPGAAPGSTATRDTGENPGTDTDTGTDRTTDRTTGTAPRPPRQAAADRGGPTERGNLTVGAAKAGALLDRQLTLARTRAHSTALQALGSSRFHAVADKVAVLASEVPLAARPTAPRPPIGPQSPPGPQSPTDSRPPAAPKHPADPNSATGPKPPTTRRPPRTATTPTAKHPSSTDLRPLAAAAADRLADAVAALPLVTAGSPYNAEALVHGLSPDPSPHPQDAPWHQVRLLLRLHRYAREVLLGEDAPVDARLLSAGQALNRHRDASEAAAAAAQAARTPRIAPATAYALGVLHADQRHEVEAARYAFQNCWQKETVGTA